MISQYRLYRPVRLRLANGELHIVTWKSWQNFLEKLERETL